MKILQLFIIRVADHRFKLEQKIGTESPCAGEWKSAVSKYEFKLSKYEVQASKIRIQAFKIRIQAFKTEIGLYTTRDVYLLKKNITSYESISYVA